jgi:hypothetical protein
MKITESQLRQLIRTQLTNVLKEIADIKQSTLIGTTTFGELKRADVEAMRARGQYQDSATGKGYPAVSVFQNMGIKDDKKVDVFQTPFQIFMVILNPDGDGNLQYAIGRDTVQGLNLKPVAKQVQGAAKSVGGVTAGLPPRNVAEAKLRASIKKQINDLPVRYE